MTTNTTMFAVAVALVGLIQGPQTGFAQSGDTRGDILIGLDGVPSMGENNAKVTMVEFSDYQ